MISASNFITFSGMTVSALMFMLLFNFLHVPISAIFLMAAVLTLVVSIAAAWFVRVPLMYFVVKSIIRILYRQQVDHPDRVPETGGALLVANHVSLVDALLLVASADRRVRFLMHRPIFERWWIKPIAKAGGAIPIEAGSSSENVADALSEATSAIQNGDLVAIFAEGQISRTGEILPFKRGLERIMAETDNPIIPVHLEGMWGSIFSYSAGKFFWKLPRQLPLAMTITYGKPLHAQSSATEVQQAVTALGAV